MTSIQSLLLGALQGVAEFLPISSSGHLVLLRQLLDMGEIPLLYDVLLHVSTLIVVIIVFRSKIGSIFASIWRSVRASGRPTDREELRLALYILIATVVTGAVGFVLSRFEGRCPPCCYSQP
jgi:undecaprenyl-diphosphatase